MCDKVEFPKSDSMSDIVNDIKDIDRLKPEQHLDVSLKKDEARFEIRGSFKNRFDLVQFLAQEYTAQLMLLIKENLKGGEG